MTIEQMVFSVTISSFVLCVEGVFIGISNLFSSNIPEWSSRVGAGLLLFALAAVYYRINFPKRKKRRGV